MVEVIQGKGDIYSLNYCHGNLASTEGTIINAWRFPIIDTYIVPNSESSEGLRYNTVTFIFSARVYGSYPDSVEVIGTFTSLYERIPLRRLLFEGEPTDFWAVSIKVPHGQVCLYKFYVDNQPILDPINPQRAERPEDGTLWSRFFTWETTQPIVLQRWEYGLLGRLCDHILPFRTREVENFLQRFYFNLDRNGKEQNVPHAYRLEDSIGAINYIDKILAREEGHRLVDYKICLKLIDEVLRGRNAFQDPDDNIAAMGREMFVELYEQMAANSVPGWDYNRYSNPRFFLTLLRRHAWTGAFAHPKYGGNGGAAAWAYLTERYKDEQGTLYDWRQALERPYGINPTYVG